MTNNLTNAAAILGRKGGSVRSTRKAQAARENAKLGGWPKGRPRKHLHVTTDFNLENAADTER